MQLIYLLKCKVNKICNKGDVMPGLNGVKAWRLKGDKETKGLIDCATFCMYNQRTSADLAPRDSENQKEFPANYRRVYRRLMQIFDCKTARPQDNVI